MVDNKKAEPTNVLPETITITIDGSSRDIFMSFGLLNHLTTIVSDPARVATIPINPTLREEVLKATLAQRKKSGKIEAEVDIDDIDISIADVESVLDWVAGHVMSFFVRSMKKVVAVTQANQKDLQGLVSFLDGSKGLASETPSSGPLE